MTRRHLQLSGSTRIDRIDMTARIAEAISRSGAWLVDFSVFSNISTTMRLELPSRRVAALGRCLRATGLSLDESDQHSVESWADADGATVVAVLNITFVQDETGSFGESAIVPA